MKIFVHRVYEINTDMPAKALIAAVNSRMLDEVGNGLEVLDMSHTAYALADFYDAGDFTELTDIVDQYIGWADIDQKEKDARLSWNEWQTEEK